MKCNDLETYLSTLLGVPWKVAIDAEYIYPLATDSYAQDNTGSMFTEFVASRRLECNIDVSQIH